VVVDPSQVELAAGASSTLRATVRDVQGNAVHHPQPVWTSTDTTVATVSAEGVVTARKVGTTRVFASVPGDDADATVRVVPPSVASVAVNPPTASLAAGGTQQLTAAVRDVTGAERSNQTVAWTSDNETVATVSPFGGLVTGRAAGTAKITATVDGKSGSATVTVTGAVGSPRTTTADFAVGCTYLVCAFTDLSTPGDGATVVAWAWTFGDGQASPHRNSDNRYPTAGSHQVTLTVTDDKGATHSTAKSVVVTALPGPAAGVRLVHRESGRCMSVERGDATRGARLVTRACDTGNDQRFALPVGGGVGPVQLTGTADRYLEAGPTGLVLWTWNGAQHQRWTYTAAGQLRNWSTNTCVTVGDGGVLTTEGCRTAAAQQWDVRS
jgi:PKD repeat protein